MSALAKLTIPDDLEYLKSELPIWKAVLKKRQQQIKDIKEVMKSEKEIIRQIQKRIQEENNKLT